MPTRTARSSSVEPSRFTAYRAALEEHAQRLELEASIYEPSIPQKSQLPIYLLEWPDDGPEVAYLALEPWQARVPALAAPRAAGRVHLLGLWSDPPRSHFADPFGGDPGRFRDCFRALREAVERLAGDLGRGASDGR